MCSCHDTSTVVAFVALFENFSSVLLSCLVSDDIHIEEDFPVEEAVNIGEDWSVTCTSKAFNQSWTANWLLSNGSVVPVSSGGCGAMAPSVFVERVEGTIIEGELTKQFQEVTLRLCNVDESITGNYTCAIGGVGSRIVSIVLGGGGGTVGGSHSNGFSSVIAIVVVIVALLVFIAVLVIVITLAMVYTQKRKHGEFEARGSEDLDRKHGELPAAAPVVITMDTPKGLGPSMKLDVDMEWYPPEQLVILGELGSGQFGKVCEVRAPGILKQAPHKTLAAAKTVKGGVHVYLYRCSCMHCDVLLATEMVLAICVYETPLSSVQLDDWFV